MTFTCNGCLLLGHKQGIFKGVILGKSLLKEGRSAEIPQGKKWRERQQMGHPFGRSLELFGCSISGQLSSAPGESGRGGTEGWEVLLQGNEPLEFAGLGNESGAGDGKQVRDKEIKGLKFKEFFSSSRFLECFLKLLCLAELSSIRHCFVPPGLSVLG